MDLEPEHAVAPAVPYPVVPGAALGPAIVTSCPRLTRRRATRLAAPPLLLEPPQQWNAEESGDLWMALQPSTARLLAQPGPLAWAHPLRPFQLDGVALLLSRPCLLLADDMGLGKTIQTIAALRVLFYRGLIRSALVVCPVSLLSQWRRELGDWAPELSVLVVRGPATDRNRFWRAAADVHLVGYETLRGDVWDGSPAQRRAWGVVVLDEASRIKNPAAGVTAACRRLTTERRWALTGTPLENVTGDVVSILGFLSAETQPFLAEAPRALRARLAEVQLRRRKAEVLPELPAKHLVDLPLELLPAQRAAYDRARDEGLLQLNRLGDQLRITHILELILRLKQLCNLDPLSGASAKLDDLSWRLREVSASGHRALVFSQFADARFGVEYLASHLADLQPLCFTGRLSPAEREDVTRRFGADETHRVMLLSVRAGGLGLNLQAASYVCHFDRWWNPAVETQAEDRAHRLGQTVPVTVYRYLCTDTIEERIDELLRAKRQLFQEVIEPVTLDARRLFTKAELRRLVGLAAATRLPLGTPAP